jgi:hypothetical protein
VNADDARQLLDRIRVIRDICDLDLLVFFARHPRSLLSSDALARFLGHDLREIADSLETLSTAGLLTRTQTSAHAARLYVLNHGDDTAPWLPSLVALASSRVGRLALRQELRRRPREGTRQSLDRLERDAAARRWPAAVRRDDNANGPWRREEVPNAKAG